MLEILPKDKLYFKCIPNKAYTVKTAFCGWPRILEDRHWIVVKMEEPLRDIYNGQEKHFNLVYVVHDDGSFFEISSNHYDILQHNDKVFNEI